MSKRKKNVNRTSPHTKEAFPYSLVSRRQILHFNKLLDGTFRHRAPTHGEHTDAILGEIGYSAKDIGALRDKGVV
jgi:crotonobetainyl-CoA:carnitine CoA-transferase CaiB-like acyl-CoA transferase